MHSRMRYKIVFITLIVLCCYLFVDAHQSSIGVSYDKITTLVFEEEIIDAELGSQEYDVKVKGRYLLLRAKNASVAPTSLFVRYGSKPQHYYVAEIAPSQEAPLQYIIPLDRPNQVTKSSEERPSPFTDTTQEYFDIGIIQNEGKVILTKLLHEGGSTWMQLYIENTSKEDLCLEPPKFTYITTVRSGFWFWNKAEKQRIVASNTAPNSVVVPAHRGRYVAFSIPIYEARESLSVCLETLQGASTWKFTISFSILREANRK